MKVFIYLKKGCFLPRRFALSLLLFCLLDGFYSPALANKQLSNAPFHGKPFMVLFFQVMMWIHGGSLLIGGAWLYDGSALSAYEDVVVVAIQYRLGITGFFR